MKDLYRKLLQKKYVRTIRSIPDYKLLELLEYAQNVNGNAELRMNNIINPETLFNWPYPLPDDITIENKLKDWFITSGMIIKLLEGYFKEHDKSNPELALLMFYRGETMKNDRSDLYNKFRKYSKRVNRVGSEENDEKNKNKIELFEKVIEQLTEDQKIQAEKDLKVLIFNIDNQ